MTGTDESVNDPTANEAEVEEMVTEAEAEAGAEGGEQDLQLLLEDARAKADEHWEMVLRAQAELDNMRRRSERELEKAHKFGAEKLLEALLPVQDSLQLGLSAAADENTDINQLREGNELTLKLMTDTLVKFGVEEVNPEGEPFDPDVHQAMSMVESPDLPPNTVMTVVQKGFTLHGRVLRPAMVVVSRGAAQKIDEEA